MEILFQQTIFSNISEMHSFIISIKDIDNFITQEKDSKKKYL
jgi:hypothetical protein